MSDRSRTARVIALMNQKGGVGKTTTTVNLGAALAASGRRVLLVDMDPQAHLTLHLGIDPAALERSVYDLLIDEAVTTESVVRRAEDGLDVLPAEVDLAGAEQELGDRSEREAALKRKLGAVADQYDFVLLDCPPSLGLLTVNALAAAVEVIVPMQAHFLALQGLSKLLETVQLVRQNVNTSLRVTGVVLCVHDAQTNLAGEVVRDLEQFFEASRKLAMPWSDAVIFRPPIRRNIRLAECPSFGQTVLRYAPKSAGAADYRRLAAQLTGAAETAGGDTADGGNAGDEGDSADNGARDAAGDGKAADNGADDDRPGDDGGDSVEGGEPAAERLRRRDGPAGADRAGSTNGDGEGDGAPGPDAGRAKGAADGRGVAGRAQRMDGRGG